VFLFAVVYELLHHAVIQDLLLSVQWHCWLGIRKSIWRLACKNWVVRCWHWPVKTEWWGVDIVICLERGADCLCMVQLMLLLSKNPIISCLINIQTGFSFWYRLPRLSCETSSWTGVLFLIWDLFLISTQLFYGPLSGSRYQKKPSPAHTHEEQEEGFAQTTRSVAW